MAMIIIIYVFWSHLGYFHTLINTKKKVGKAAEDNDELTLNPKYRDGNDWWLHASGCPGSHVVIRSNGNDILEHDVVQDAAALAARQSKCTGSVIKVRSNKIHTHTHTHLAL
jgi:predicted ribosome quality control (RQC) complex YloA/Tae2 family protein